ANLAHGVAHRFKPGQSGNPGGRPRTAKLSEACRAKLASAIPGDPESRSYAEAIADKLAQLALKGDIRAAQELADRAQGRPSQMAPPTEYSGVKYIVLDMPRPQRPVALAASPQSSLHDTVSVERNADWHSARSVALFVPPTHQAGMSLGPNYGFNG